MALGMMGRGKPGNVCCCMWCAYEHLIKCLDDEFMYLRKVLGVHRAVAAAPCCCALCPYRDGQHLAAMSAVWWVLERWRWSLCSEGAGGVTLRPLLLFEFADRRW
ncbi:unnamed protein product [Ostreobium quekettii]|uniref:Uncharacterized protein n=1 Tax=Ostreobium quekettii TaxID=121088 RepID=A0A8S1IWU0_9CHLO|nr:unnamed protein product [Ostreobium quekettii]